MILYIKRGGGLDDDMGLMLPITFVLLWSREGAAAPQPRARTGVLMHIPVQRDEEPLFKHLSTSSWEFKNEY